MNPQENVSWLYLDLNSFFASVEQQENPKLRGKPVAVVPMMADSTSCLAASYEAKKHGVKTGTKVRDAKLMCPGIQFVESNHETYIRYHHRIIEVVESCIPVHSILSIDEIAAELTGSQQQVEVACKVAMKIKEAIREKIGPTVTASIGLSTNRFLAKIATDMKKPDGLTIIRKMDLPHKLHSLTLRDIPGVGAAMEERILKMGIRTVAELLSKNKPEMEKIWGGVWGDRMFRWLKGEHVELPPQKSRSISHEHVLPPDKRTREGSCEIGKKLLTKLAWRLRKNNDYTKNLNVRVKFIGSEDSYWENSAKFNELRDTVSLLRKLEELWLDIPRGKTPLKISVSFADLVRHGFHQFSFFENPKLDQISQVMDNINKKYGRDTLHLGATHDQKESAPTGIAFRRIPGLDEFD